MILNILVFLLVLFTASRAEATILFQQSAEAGTCDAGVATGVWDYTSSGQSPLSRYFYLCDTPVPNSGRSKYFRSHVEGDNGTSTSVGTNTLTDSTKSWPTNRWQPGPDEPYKLRDSNGVYYNIASNTATTITVSTGNPAAGTYWIVGQHDSYNTRVITSIPMTVGQDYFFGLFVRFDKINDIPVWHDNCADFTCDGALPNSYDKAWEIDGSDDGAGFIITAGFNDWVECPTPANICDDKFTLGLYLRAETCTSCLYQQQEHNVAPYSRTNPFLSEYGRWYAVVYGVTPSNGSATDGRLRLWVNGILLTDLPNVKTQDSTTPHVDLIAIGGTIAQPAYDGAAHHRKLDLFTFASSQQDMIDAGLMSDPEAGGGGTGGALSVRGARRGGFR